MAESHGGEHGHHGPTIMLYLGVFAALCVFTAMSFGIFEVLSEQKMIAMLIILLVAVCKAFLVATYFMHLKWDWGKVYFIMIPVMIVALMMMLVLLPDIVLDWHHEHERDEPAAEITHDHH